MNQKWNPVFSIEVQASGMVILFDLAGWHCLGVRISTDGNLLRVHRSPLDGPHEEVVLECPPNYDAQAATGKADAGTLRIDLPLRPDLMREKLLAEQLGAKLKRALVELPEGPEQINAPPGDFSEN